MSDTTVPHELQVREIYVPITIRLPLLAAVCRIGYATERGFPR